MSVGEQQASVHIHRSPHRPGLVPPALLFSYVSDRAKVLYVAISRCADSGLDSTSEQLADDLYPKG